MNYLVCAAAIVCAAAFFSVGLMSEAVESGYTVPVRHLAAR